MVGYARRPRTVTAAVLAGTRARYDGADMRIALLGCALALAAVPAAAPPPQHPTLVVEAPPELAQAAARVRALADEDFGPELRMIGAGTFDRPIRIVLAPLDSGLARRAPSWVSGYAMGAVSTIVLFPQRVPSYPDRNLEALVRHEIAHLLVFQASGGRPLPRWFNEGVATVAALEWGIGDRARYAAAVIGSGPRSLHALDDAFSGAGGSVTAAYALSAAFTRSLQQRFGADVIRRIIAGVKRGMPFRAAFRAATGTTLGEVEHDFFGREAFWNTWVPFLTSSGVLWLAITALALFAIHRRRIRDRRLRESWAAEDELAALAAARPEHVDDAADDVPEDDDPASGDPRRFN